MPNLKDFIANAHIDYELIPSITTTPIAQLADEIARTFFGVSKKSKCCKHNFPYSTKSRRVLGLPNPLNHIFLCNLLLQKWEDIEGFLLRSKLSITRPYWGVNKEVKGEVLRRDFSKIRTKKIEYATNSRFALQTDFSKFYRTIYTHSIPWALHGKDVAKRNRSRSLLGNEIDEYVRCMLDGQTIGIPVGTSASHIIAEIIGTAIDLKLYEELGDIQGFRYVDDYILFFATRFEAERALNCLRKIANHFELELNDNKTEIHELPIVIENKWVHELKVYEFKDSAKHQDIVPYFSKMFEFSKIYPGDSVLKYGLKKIQTVFIKKENWSIYESLLLQCINCEPSIIPIVCKIIHTYNKKGYDLNFKRISENITTNIKHFGHLHYSYEISWLLYLAKILKIKITDETASIISNNEDNIIALVALDLRENGLIPSGLDTSKWLPFLNKNELYSDNWLLAYEAKVRGWIKTSEDYIKEDEFYKFISERNVRFYDDKKELGILSIRKLDKKEGKEPVDSEYM